MKAVTRSRERGFTLLEVLVAAVIMGIAVAGVLSGLAAASRNGARLTEYDRATLLARQKMNQLLADHDIPRGLPLTGVWPAALTGGTEMGWNARIDPFEAAPGAGPGMWVVDRAQLEIWWMDGATRRSFSLEGYRRGILKPGDVVNAATP